MKLENKSFLPAICLTYTTIVAKKYENVAYTLPPGTC